MVINLWVLCIEDGTDQHRLIKNWEHHPISIKVHSLDSKYKFDSPCRGLLCFNQCTHRGI